MLSDYELTVILNILKDKGNVCLHEYQEFAGNKYNHYFVPAYELSIANKDIKITKEEFDILKKVFL